MATAILSFAGFLFILRLLFTNPYERMDFILIGFYVFLSILGSIEGYVVFTHFRALL
jgi:hypothetical protein